MNNNIIDIEEIIKSELDNNHYVETLLASLQRHKIITIEEYEQIILKLINLLSTSIKKYTGELACSIKKESAKNLNDSNLWTIGLYLKKKSIKESIDILLKENINDIYKNGKKELDAFFDRTKFFYSFVKKDFISTDNYFYNSTLKYGITGFFKVYNAWYDACNICIIADYTPFLGRPKALGVEFIKQYLESINYENIFCQKFKSKSVKHMLKRIYPNYEEMLINIFENVLTVAVVLRLQNQNIYNLNVDDIDTESLYHDFKNKNEFISKLKKSYEKVKNEISVNDKLNNYLDRSFELIKNNIIKNAENNSLELLLGTKNKKQIVYTLNDKMRNAKYKELLSRLNNCEKNERVAILKESAVSLLDIIDICKQVDFSSDELFALFSNFKTIELMALKKICFDLSEDSDMVKELDNYIMTKSIEEQNIINNNYENIRLVINKHWQ